MKLEWWHWLLIAGGAYLAIQFKKSHDAGKSFSADPNAGIPPLLKKPSDGAGPIPQNLLDWTQSSQASLDGLNPERSYLR